MLTEKFWTYCVALTLICTAFQLGTWVSRPAPVIQVQMQPQEVRINNTCDVVRQARQ